MAEIKIAADAGGGWTSLKGPANTSNQNAFVLPSADGSAGQYLKTDGSKNLGWASDSSGGITHASEWRVNTAFAQDTGLVINANWEEADDASYSRIGSAVTQSSGVFTLPEAGIWRIDLNIYAYQTDAHRRYFEGLIQVSTNSGGAYDARALCVGNLYDSDADTISTAYCSTIQDVTDASAFRVRFYFSASADTILYGHTDTTYTGAIFTRLGDT